MRDGEERVGSVACVPPPAVKASDKAAAIVR